MDRTIEVKAKAIFNEETQCWEVSIEQVDNFENLIGEFCTTTINENVKVLCCDEFVVANAILHANGINLENLYNGHNPIINWQN